MPNFTRHFKLQLVYLKRTVVTDHCTLQSLHIFEDPETLTTHWLGKPAVFNHQVGQRTGKSFGHLLVSPEQLSEPLTPFQLKIQPQEQGSLASISDAFYRCAPVTKDHRYRSHLAERDPRITTFCPSNSNKCTLITKTNRQSTEIISSVSGKPL